MDRIILSLFYLIISIVDQPFIKNKRFSIFEFLEICSLFNRQYYLDGGAQVL